MVPQIQHLKHKNKIKELGHIKIYNVCVPNDAIEKKITPSMGEIVAKHISDKGLTPRMNNKRICKRTFKIK